MGRVADAGCIVIYWLPDWDPLPPFDPSKVDINVNISRGLQRLPKEYLSRQIGSLVSQIQVYISLPHVENYPEQMKHNVKDVEGMDIFTKHMHDKPLSLMPYGEAWKKMIAPKLASKYQ